MKIFVCEFVTGGGLYREPLPPGLAREGTMMLHALLEDLAEVPNIEVSTTRDVRMPDLAGKVDVRWVKPDADVWAVWASCIQASDAVWLIAPETDGVLEKLSRLAVSCGKALIGCPPDMVALAASKSRTGAVLASAGIRVVPTWQTADVAVSASVGPWVLKPDDGAGCEDTVCINDAADLQRAFERNSQRRPMVIQPFVSGIPASLSMICRGGRAWLLSANRQDVRLAEQDLVYYGGELNGMAAYWEVFEALAGEIASALPALAGYVGVDVIVNDADDVTVLEINPRLTTSYAAMRAATGLNPARLVLELFYNDVFTFPRTLQRQVVRVSLNETTSS